MTHKNTLIYYSLRGNHYTFPLVARDVVTRLSPTDMIAHAMIFDTPFVSTG